MNLKDIFGGSNAVTYNNKKKLFTVKLDKNVAQFFSVILSAVPTSSGLNIKGTTLTFVVKDETLALPVLDLLKSAGVVK